MTDRKGSQAQGFAVIGIGAIAQIMHVPILAEREDVDLVAVSDVDTVKARTVADRYGVPDVLADEEILARDDIDAVVICTPNHLHERQAIAALQAGKHVFVERPLALDPEGAERVLAAAREAGRTVVVGQPHRFRPEVSALRSYVAGGEMGDLYSFRGSWLTRRVQIMRPTWRQNAAKGGGALLDLGVPAFDLAFWLVGYPAVRRLSCVVRSGEFDVEDAATIMGETVDGMAFTMEVSSRYFAPEDRFYARVMGSEGSASLPPLEIYKQLGGRPLDVTPRQPKPRGGENPYTNAYRRQLDYFVRGVAGTTEPALPVEQVALMRLIAAAARSAESGREVEP